VWDRLYPYYLWIENTSIGHGIRESKWMFALTEVFHLFGITLFLGTVLILALRTFGFVLQKKTVSGVAREIMPWSMSGLTLTILTGTLLFMSETTKCWGNIAFRYKTLFFFLAISFQFTVLHRVIRGDERRFSPLARRITALVAVFLWFGVAVFGRAVFFF
jgi:hypothetical protein